MKLSVSVLLLLFTTLSQAQSWVRQNPFAKISQLRDIHFDGKHGLAVGDDAAIYTTSNSGTMWIPRTAVPGATTLSAAFVVPGTMGKLMFAGGDSILMISETGGEVWKTSYVDFPNVYKIQLLPDGTILALGSDFGIYSVDKGITWQPFNMPAFGVTAGHFVSIQEGWVGVGGFDNAKVWYTNDGGFTWNIRDPFIYPLISSIEMINDSVGFLASRDFIYKTIDRGFSWFPLHTIAAGFIQDLHVTDENNLWAALDNGSVYFSNAGGSVWQEINPNLINSNHTLGIWANAAGKVWLVGKYLSILHSPDFGQTWFDQLPAAKQTLFEPNFFNAFVGMVGGSDGAILKTNNSGATWDPILLPRNENFFGTVMIGDSTIVVGSSSGKVFRSDDQGATWSILVENLGQITDLFAFNRQEMILTNENGDIFKTTNSGVIWSRVHDGSKALFAIDFQNAQVGWAVGATGLILATTNGGNTWSTQFNDKKNTFSDVHFISSTEGWVTASNFTDSIWHTTNAGVTWGKILLPFRSFWRAVSFMNVNTGWLVGGSDGNGVILRTDNQGQNWFLDHTSPDPFMGVYAIPNSETVWAVGFGGNIMKYSSCTSPPLLTQLRGNLEPCIGDTITFEVVFDDVDVFDWTFPSNWLVIGNTNTASIHFIAGSAPGIVTVQGSDACGDTTAQLSAMVVPVVIPEVKILEENGILVSNTGNGFYQWLKNGVNIPGANDEMYRPTSNGTYQLHFTTFTSGCEATSNTFKFGLIPTLFVDDDKLTVFPNPAKDFFIVTYNDGNYLPAGSKVIMTSFDGRQVLNSQIVNNQINIPGVPPGLYTILIQTDKELLLRKVMIE